MSNRRETFAHIHRAFPGMFTYRDMLNLDERDLKVWSAMAGRELWTRRLSKTPSSDTAGTLSTKLHLRDAEKALDSL